MRFDFVGNRFINKIFKKKNYCSPFGIKTKLIFAWCQKQNILIIIFLGYNYYFYFLFNFIFCNIALMHDLHKYISSFLEFFVVIYEIVCLPFSVIIYNE